MEANDTSSCILDKVVCRNWQKKSHFGYQLSEECGFAARYDTRDLVYNDYEQRTTKQIINAQLIPCWRYSFTSWVALFTNWLAENDTYSVYKSAKLRVNPISLVNHTCTFDAETQVKTFRLSVGNYEDYLTFTASYKSVISWLLLYLSYRCTAMQLYSISMIVVW